MATLTTAFNLATGSLNADQAALAVVANNVSNANTPGYTREVATFEENDPVTINEAQYGTGASMTGGVSQRDLVLDQGLQQQQQMASASGARLTALEQVESIFSSAIAAGSSSTAAGGLAQDLPGFFDSLSSLEADPASPSLRQQVMASAANLAEDFNSASSQLSGQQASADQQTSAAVEQVNALTEAIAELNRQISSSDPHSDAGTFEDQRQQDIQQLSKLIGVHRIQTENNGLEITTANGALLVSGSQSFTLSTASVSGSLHVFDSDGGDITSNLLSGGGQIGGLLTASQQDIPQMQSALDALAYGLGTAVNAQNEVGSDANGSPGVAIFTLPPTAAGAAAGIAVNVTDPAQIAAAAVGAGPASDTNLLEMAGLRNQAIVSGATPVAYYSDFVSTVGSLVARVSTENTVQQASVAQIQGQINSLSGVNLNDEAASLENFEQSYESASKVFSILTAVMSAALNLGVATSYSL